MQRGFTLIELMITLVIGVILLAVGIPSFKSIIDSTRLTTSANSLVMAMVLARSEAVKTGRDVTISATEGGEEDAWIEGYFVSFDYDNDGEFGETFADDTHLVDADSDPEDELILWKSLNGSMDYITEISEVVYKPDGTVELDTGDITDVIAIQPVDCDGDVGRRKEIKFGNTGQVRVLTKDCPSLS